VPDHDEEVGYGKPPKKTRFKKGQSGNPKGRPKGAKNLATIVADVCQETALFAFRRQPNSVSNASELCPAIVNTCRRKT
jgi:hypothetical protein